MTNLLPQPSGGIGSLEGQSFEKL